MLLLGPRPIRVLESGWLRAVLVFAVGATTETLQCFGVEVFGRTFAPLDYVMFALGGCLTMVLERKLRRRFPSEAVRPLLERGTCRRPALRRVDQPTGGPRWT